MNARLRVVAVANLFFLIPGVTYAQTHLKLILNTRQAIDSAYIVNFSSKEVRQVPFQDTLDLVFKYEQTGYYHFNYLQKGKVYNAKLYLDTGFITVVMLIENDILLVNSVMGSPTYEMTRNWNKQYAEMVLQKDSSAMDAFLLKTYEEQIENIFSFAIGGRYLNMHQNDKLKLYTLLPLIAQQPEALKKQFGFSLFNDRLRGIIGNDSVILSGFNLIDRENKRVTVQIKDPAFIILDFWFVGCLPCMEDHEKIGDLLPFLKEKNTQLISISDDDSYKKWKDYLKKHHYSWLHYKKPPETDNIVTRLGISTYPTYILLDKNGTILFSTYSLEAVLKELK